MSNPNRNPTPNLDLGDDLPTNISRHENGLLVRVVRRGVTFRAFVPNGFKGDQLAEASRRRDHFLQLAGPIPKPTPPARSNTGIAGISETTAWSRGGYSCPIFTVDWREHGLRRHCHIRYGKNGLSRQAALEQAKALRARVAGPLRINPLMMAFDLNPDLNLNPNLPA